MPPKPVAKKAGASSSGKPAAAGAGAKAKGSTAGTKPKAKAAAASSTKKTTSKTTSEKDVTNKLANLSISTTDSGTKPTPTVIDITFQELGTVLKDDDGRIKASGKWPLIVEASGRAAVFFRYQGGSMTDALSPGDMAPEALRMKLLGGLRYGTYFVLDFGDADLYNACEVKFDDVKKGLFEEVVNKTYLKNFAELIKESDGPEYEEKKFSPQMMEEFKFVVISKKDPSPKMAEKFCIMKVKQD